MWTSSVVGKSGLFLPLMLRLRPRGQAFFSRQRICECLRPPHRLPEGRAKGHPVLLLTFQILAQQTELPAEALLIFGSQALATKNFLLCLHAKGKRDPPPALTPREGGQHSLRPPLEEEKTRHRTLTPDQDRRDVGAPNLQEQLVLRAAISLCTCCLASV